MIEADEIDVRGRAGLPGPCPAAIRGDAADMLGNPRPAAFPLLWAPRGLMDEPGGLYRADQLAGPDGEMVPDAEMVPDVNHYTVRTGAGAERVAQRIIDGVAR